MCQELVTTGRMDFIIMEKSIMTLLFRESTGQSNNVTLLNRSLFCIRSVVELVPVWEVILYPFLKINFPKFLDSPLQSSPQLKTMMSTYLLTTVCFLCMNLWNILIVRCLLTIKPWWELSIQLRRWLQKIKELRNKWSQIQRLPETERKPTIKWTTLSRIYCLISLVQQGLKEF